MPTATFSPVSLLPGVGATSGLQVLDPEARTFSFAAYPSTSPASVMSYWTIDIDTGAVLSIVPVREVFDCPEYDPVTGAVFALHWNASAHLEEFGTVDITTATFSPIAVLPGIEWIGGAQILDPVARIYSFSWVTASRSEYVSVDIDSGAIVAIAPLPRDLVSLQYDAGTGRVAALHWNATTMVEEFGTLDVPTATFSPMSTLPDVLTIRSEGLVNPIERTYTFVRAGVPGDPSSGATYVAWIFTEQDRLTSRGLKPVKGAQLGARPVPPGHGTSSAALAGRAAARRRDPSGFVPKARAEHPERARGVAEACAPSAVEHLSTK